MAQVKSFKEMIAKYIGSADNRKKFAKIITTSLRKYRDYSAVGRKAFLVEELEDGVPPIYEKDPEVKAYVVGDSGDNLISLAGSDKVTFPLFTISAEPQATIEQIRDKRFNLVKRNIELGVAAVKEKEDRRVFASIDALTADADNPHEVMEVEGYLTPSSLIDAFASVEQHGLRVARVFMNPLDYASIRKWDRDTLDIDTQGQLLRTGYVGKVWGAQLITSRIITQGRIYICAEREFYGRMPVRVDLTVLSADIPHKRIVGFSIFEHLGIGAYNPLASQVLVVNSTSSS